MIKRILSFALAIVLAAALIPTQAFAETSSVSKTASVADSSAHTYNVSLALPTEQSVTTSDVVFVLDKSSSTSSTGFAAKAASMLDALSQLKNCDIKVSVIVFDFKARDAINVVDSNYSGLVDITNDATALANAKSSFTAISSGSGTNLPAGLYTAKTLLDADTSVASENKYVIQMSDAATYFLSDGEGNAYERYYGTAGTAGMAVGQSDSEVPTGYTTAAPSYTVEKFEALLDSGTLMNGTTADSNSLTSVSESWGEYPEPELYGNHDVKATMPSGLTTPNVPVMAEKSTYESAEALLAMKTSGYNIVTLSQLPYGKAPVRFNLAKTFFSWIWDTSTNTGAIGPRYDLDSMSAADVTAMMNNIQHDIEYQCYRGTITDTMGEHFDLVLDNGSATANTFTLSVAGTVLTGTQIATNEIGFGSDGNGGYAYVITYDLSTDSFTLAINVPVEKAKPLKVSYEVVVSDYDALEEGTHELPTNESAVLTYLTSSDSAAGVTVPTRTITFPVPTVSVTKTVEPATVVPATTVPVTPVAKVAVTGVGGLPATGDPSSTPWVILGSAAFVACMAAATRRVSRRRK